jgi:hypothetical protein
MVHGSSGRLSGEKGPFEIDIHDGIPLLLGKFDERPDIRCIGTSGVVDPAVQPSASNAQGSGNNTIDIFLVGDVSNDRYHSLALDIQL